MKSPVTDPLQPRCGNCKFWDKLDRQPANIPPQAGQVGVCGGLPFQVLLMGVKQSQFTPNQGEMVTEFVRPNVPETLPPCALYVPVDIPVLRATGPTSKLNG